MTHCENPDCLVCGFVEKHPEETRWSLITAVAEVLKYQVACMAFAEETVRSAVILHEGQKVDKEDPANAEILQMSYNQIIDQEWEKDLPLIAKSLQIVFEVALLSLPPDCVGAAKQHFLEYLVDKGELLHDTAAAHRALQYADHFIQQILDTGAANLEGKQGTVAGFEPPSTLQ